ncbi:Hypothetical protein GSB_151600 [Giardia duodenalis]|uniref:Uncharacterized protein n=1 Tax=Giardia intestinalis TaxID=5741 RepID=V6TZZ2_GIAIN|nr:Hypothetical protein GSB_151600 [Giardia intestinalis]
MATACSPPPSDCREAPEQKEPNRLLTDTGKSSEHPAHQATSPMNTILTTRQPSREPTHRETDTHSRQPATTARSETPATTLHHPAKHREEPPILTSRPTSPPDGHRVIALLVRLRAPQARGPAAQHWKQPVGGVNHQLH